MIVERMKILDENIERRSVIGQYIILNYFNSLPNTRAFAALDPYDAEKDLVVRCGDNEENVEVKTTVPYILLNSLVLKKNQYKKIINAKLIWISAPFNTDLQHYSCGNCYYVNPKNGYFKTIDDNECMVFPIEKMEIFHILPNDQIELLKKYTISKYPNTNQ